MKQFSLIAFSVAVLGACASSATTSVSTGPAPTAVAPNITATTLSEAPRNWQLLDETADHIAGISAERAYRELLAGKSPKRTVVVAIIDGGVDTTHADLRPNLWSNPKPAAASGQDGVGGYPGDARGWNFIGGRNGRDVDHDTYEVTRQYARCTGKPAAAGEPPLTAADRARCPEITADFEKQRGQSDRMEAQVASIRTMLDQIVPVLRKATGGGTDSLTEARVSALTTSDPTVARAKQAFLALAANGITPAMLDDMQKQVDGDSKYALDPAYDPRPIVGDHYADLSERYYGNPDVTGPDALHGTHVAGIIGAVRDNSAGIGGVATAVRLMGVRAVPDGDERDKDIANAIRFAVDNGAQVINMSFGKGYSPYKSAVDDAVKYADAHGVLMVHAAGNDGADLAQKANFPTPAYLDGGHPTNWIEVGASSWKGGEELPASFSNYGRDQVDVFAPGVDLLSSVPGNKFQRESGTSMASPVVTGLAALIMEYYPNLSASDVKQIILASATRHNDQVVTKPGGANGEKVPFGTLSRTGGIVNAYSALKMAASWK